MNKQYSIVYEYKGALYLNITNRCPNLCVFCIKLKWNMNYRGYNLKIDNEPSSDEVVKEIVKKFEERYYNEIVFCGYGEPLMRWDVVKKIISEIRKGMLNKVTNDIRIRINTNGMGNLICRRDITEELCIVDSIYISLNTVDKIKWYEIMRPFEQFKEGAFESVIEFIKNAKKSVKEVVVTAVDLKGVDIKAVEKFANELNVGFKLRPYLDEYEET
ncbi:MAG: TatD family nuclease-associated radical SAM protein [Elusimicrobiales bacterium]|nr:TatD family nuclease-associated radical SAM protein [Elusimicrobiales bacterium]